MWLIKMNNELDEKCSVSLIYILVTILSANLTLLILEALSHLPLIAYMHICIIMWYIYGTTVTNYIAPEFF